MAAADGFGIIEDPSVYHGTREMSTEKEGKVLCTQHVCKRPLASKIKWIKINCNKKIKYLVDKSQFKIVNDKSVFIFIYSLRNKTDYYLDI